MDLKTGFEPTGDRVLIAQDSAETQTASGIIIPDSSQEKPLKGTIVAIGPGKHAPDTGVFIPTSLKVGQRVLFGQYSGTKLKNGEQNYLLMNENEVFGRLTEEN